MSILLEVAKSPTKWTVVALVVACTLALAGCSSSTGLPPNQSAASSVVTEAEAPAPTGSAQPTATAGAPRIDPPIAYRLDDELWVDDRRLGISSSGPPRWRPNHPGQLASISHSDAARAGIFLFEQVHLHDLATNTDTLVLDVADHGWAEAGHIDWDSDGRRLVFAALEGDGRFIPQVLDIDSGLITRIDAESQVIDTVFAPDGQILGVDTTHSADQLEPVAWVDADGRLRPLPTSTGVNRDPVVSPDGRYVANIRASGPLARIFIGRWDLVITDLREDIEWIIGDGQDGFGPPRWRDDRTLVAKHGRYNEQGVIASIPDVVTVDVIDRTVSLDSTVPLGAWDPDPDLTD